MNNIKLPCYYYPTTVVIIDDNKVFLENLPANLDNKIIYKLFENTVDALQFLETKNNNSPMQKDFLEISDDSSIDNSLFVNIYKIHQRVYDERRFETPAIIIVDYDMPGVSGIEFCKALEAYPIKKIILTGVADHKVATKAFNDEVIHRFILKDDPNVFAMINQAIGDLQSEYFSHLSELISANIATVSISSCLHNAMFHDFFLKLVQENHVIEFYLTDSFGSFLLFDDKKELTRLVVQSMEEIESYYQAAKDHEASQEIIRALSDREKLLCLFSEEDYRQSVEKWPAYLYPAHKIPSIDNSYYTLIRGENAYKNIGISKNKILSYNDYLISCNTVLARA